MEERDTNLPKLKVLRKYVPTESNFSLELYRIVEQYLLTAFNWRILVPTVADFVELYLLFIIEPNDVNKADWNNNNDIPLVTKRERLEVDQSTRLILTRSTLATDSVISDRLTRARRRLAFDVAYSLDLLLLSKY